MCYSGILTSLIVSSGPPKALNYISFKFDTSWFNNPEFFIKVETIWHKPCRAKTALDKIQQKIKLINNSLKDGGFNLQGEIRKQRKAFQIELSFLEELEENACISSDQVLRKYWVLRENFKLLEQESYWFQRSHETWLLKGDNNTEYFHRCANGRRKNTVISLEKDGEIIEGDDNLLKHASEYYAELFGPEIQYEIHMDPAIWDSSVKVSETDNGVLCQPFSEEEIKMALFQMEKNKAPGPDKIPIEFYQKCWHIIKDDIV